MLNRKNATNERHLAPSATVNIIGKGTVIEGDLHCEGDLRIDGQVKGRIFSRFKVLIGQEGSLEGELSCTEAEILGNMQGTLHVNGLLNLRGKAVVSGEIFTVRFEMEPTVRFNGRCEMRDPATGEEPDLPLSFDAPRPEHGKQPTERATETLFEEESA